MPLVPPLLRRLAVTAATAVLATLTAAPASGQAVVPLTWYTFSGCLTGVSCHTVQMVVGEVTDPRFNRPGEESWKAMLFQITTTYQPGASAPVNNPMYGVTAARGTSRVAFDDDIFRAGTGCWNNGFLPTVERTCVDPVSRNALDLVYGSTAPLGVTFIALRVSPDWVPAAFRVDVITGTPGTTWGSNPGDQLRSVTLPLVASTQVVPEPSTVALVGGGLALLAAAGRRRCRTTTTHRETADVAV